jgi:Predicted transcriptional regulators
MNKILDLGSFLSLKRKEANMTQEEVATAVGLSRTAYSQIENGNRKNISIEEIIKLSQILSFSLPDALTIVFDMPKMAIAKPMFNFKKFREVLLYILNKCRNRNNIGKVVLYKLLYFSDFNYYEKYKMFLTGTTYSKLPMGPVPNIADVLELMDLRGDIEILTNPNYYGFKKTEYIPKSKPNLSLLKEEEIKVINDVIRKLGSLSANEISEYSHGDAPWIKTSDFKEIDYDLVFKRNDKYKYIE